MIHVIDFLVPLSFIEGASELVPVVGTVLADMFGGMTAATPVTFFAEADTVSEPDSLMFRVYSPRPDAPEMARDAAMTLRILFGMTSIAVGIDGDVYKM